MSTAFLFNNKMMKYGTHVMGISSSPTPPGPTIPSVTIGNQVWMSENLAIDDGGDDIYIKQVSANGVDFGTQYYYSPAAAQRVAATVTGWHLPSKAEWETLLANFNTGNSALIALSSTTGWTDSTYTMTNSSGFTGLPVDCGSWISEWPPDVNVKWPGNDAEFASSTPVNTWYGTYSDCYTMRLNNGPYQTAYSAYINDDCWYDRYEGGVVVSVRLIKD